MSARPKLSLARAPKKLKLALVKKAIRLFRSESVPRAVWKANARKWLAAMAALGDRHILNRSTPAKWGQPGEPRVDQVYAPRRLGGA